MLAHRSDVGFRSGVSPVGDVQEFGHAFMSFRAFGQSQRPIMGRQGTKKLRTTGRGDDRFGGKHDIAHVVVAAQSFRRPTRSQHLERFLVPVVGGVK